MPGLISVEPDSTPLTRDYHTEEKEEKSASLLNYKTEATRSPSVTEPDAPSPPPIVSAFTAAFSSRTPALKESPKTTTNVNAIVNTNANDKDNTMVGDRVLPLSLSEPNILKPKFTLRPLLSSLSLPQLMPPNLQHHALKTALWIALAATVAIITSIVHGRQRALEFVTAYIVEYSLSVDNLFVFLLIFRYFRVPRDAQESVLTYGILGAMILRGIMVVCGKVLVQRFEWVGLLFAALLIYSAGKLLFEDDDDDNNLDDNRVIRFSKQILPVAERYTGNRFIIRENSRLMATPLMVVLISIELSDVVFALDSVPAVLGLSQDTFVIYMSNILAIMGLRSLFFVLSTTIGNFRFLKQALAIVLGFIGIKMIAACFGNDIGTAFSLLFVAGTLASGISLSFMFPVVLVARSPGPDVNSQSNSNIV